MIGKIGFQCFLTEETVDTINHKIIFMFLILAFLKIKKKRQSKIMIKLPIVRKACLTTRLI